MTLPPHEFPLPADTANRMRLALVEPTPDGSWGYAPGSLGDHAGLAYYRYVPLKPTRSPYKDSYATKYVEAVSRRFAGAGPWQQACETAAARLLATAESFAATGREVRHGTRTTATRLLVGMGYKNGLEVGLTFHHPGGFPYLPGTSIKGLTRAWAETVAGADAATRLRVFGSESKTPGEGEMQGGSVVFLDALPTRFPALDADLLNPHAGDYYMDDTARTAPSDWLSPVPVPFLAVGAESEFRFALVGRGDADATDVATAWTWLMAALTQVGAGGKTASGYGFFHPETSSAPRLVSVEPGASRSRPDRTSGGGGGRAQADRHSAADAARATREQVQQEKALKLRDAAEKLKAQMDAAPARATSVKKMDVVRAQLAKRGNPPRVHIAAEGHDLRFDVAAIRVPEDVPVGAWMLVKVVTFNENKGRASEVAYLGEAPEPGMLAEVPSPAARTTADGPVPPAMLDVGTGAPSSTPAESSAAEMRTGPFKGTLKRVRIRGLSAEGQIESASHEALVKFDAAAAGIDDSSRGRAVQFYVEGERAVDVELR